jgi:hypothetical protein
VIDQVAPGLGAEYAAVYRGSVHVQQHLGHLHTQNHHASALVPFGFVSNNFIKCLKLVFRFFRKIVQKYVAHMQVLKILMKEQLNVRNLMRI